MRVLFLLAFGFSSIVSAQQPAPAQPASPRGWDAVRALLPGSALDIKLRHGGEKCDFRSVSDDTLTCDHKGDIVLQRADILRVKIHHRGRSALTGLAIGAGGGAIVGAATAGPCSSFCVIGRGDVAIVLGVGGGIVGSITGYFTDFTRSVVYSVK